MQQQQQKRSFLMTLIDLFLHLSWQLLDTAFPKQKKCRQQLLLLQVFCVKLILRSKLQISDLKISEHSWIWNDFAKTYEQFHWWCDSFLHSRAVSPIKYQHSLALESIIHSSYLLFFSSFLLWLFWTDWPVLSASKVLSLTHHHHFKTLWPKKSQLFSRCFMSSWCLFDGVGRLFQDCFLYLLHTQNNDRALQKTFFFLPWMGCWTTKHYGYIL